MVRALGIFSALCLKEIAASQVPASVGSNRECNYKVVAESLGGCRELEEPRNDTLRSCSELKSNVKTYTLNAGCMDSIARVDLRTNESELQMPIKVKFGCDTCNTGQGSPILLEKCCDACVRWATNNSALPNGAQALTWCSGCDAREIKSSLGLPPFPWLKSAAYTNYTEEVVDSVMDQWVEDSLSHMCARFETVGEALLVERVSRRTVQGQLEIAMKVETTKIEPAKTSEVSNETDADLNPDPVAKRLRNSTSDLLEADSTPASCLSASLVLLLSLLALSASGERD